MTKNNKVKKRKLTKKQPVSNKIERKKLKRKKLDKILAVPKKETPAQTPIQNDSNYSDSSSGETETESEKIQKLLEPYTKDQLIAFISDAAVNDGALYTRLSDAADRDVSHRKIFVHGLCWDTTRETLVSAFESYGEVEDCNVVTDRFTGKSKGYGFVLFKTRQGATKALKQPMKKINNRITSCQLASVGPVPQPQIQDTSGRKIYVSNVQPDDDPEKLRAFFAKFGEIETGPIGFDMRTGKSRGFALFVYKTLEGSRRALQEPYKMFDGHQVHCQKAADGKNKAGGAASVTTALHPVPELAAMAAAQNLALFSQQPSLNPMYSGLLANPNAGFLPAGSVNPIVAAGSLGGGMLWTSHVGQASRTGGSFGGAATGLGGYSATGSNGLDSLGGSSSQLGAAGSIAPTLQGLQHAHPSSQIGQMSSTRAPGAGGSFSGYPSYVIIL